MHKGLEVARKALFYWAPAFGYMALIWWLSSRQLDVPTELMLMRDKGVHFVEFASLGVVLAHATLNTWAHIRERAALAALLTTVAWGLLDELHQAFVPGRTADPADLVADAVGALAGVLVYSAVWARWQRRNRERASTHQSGAQPPASRP